MNSLVERCRLSGFDENTIKSFLETNCRTAVIIKPEVKGDGKTEFFVGSAELYHPRGGERVILWVLNHTWERHIHFEELEKCNSLYLCKNRNEAKKLYSEWCKLPSTIDERKIAVENIILDYEKKILELKKELTNIK